MAKARRRATPKKRKPAGGSRQYVPIKIQMLGPARISKYLTEQRAKRKPKRSLKPKGSRKAKVTRSRKY